MAAKNYQLPIIDYTPAKYDGPSKAEVLAIRQQYLSPGLIRYYQEPLMIVEGKMQYVWDETGRRYLDAFAGIVTVSVGHSHPHVVKQVQEQLGKLQHTTTIYLHPKIGEFAQRLTGHMPRRYEPFELVLHQQWLRSKRNGDPRRPRDSPATPRSCRFAIPITGDRGDDEPHRTWRLEVQIERLPECGPSRTRCRVTATAVLMTWNIHRAI